MFSGAQRSTVDVTVEVADEAGAVVGAAGRVMIGVGVVSLPQAEMPKTPRDIMIACKYCRFINVFFAKE
jgi:hypothetical protein